MLFARRRGVVRLLLIFCSAPLFSPLTTAQLKPGDFDVTDGKIEKAPGNRLQVSNLTARLASAAIMLASSSTSLSHARPNSTNLRLRPPLPFP
jgi:hypothetical protein